MCEYLALNMDNDHIRSYKYYLASLVQILGSEVDNNQHRYTWLKLYILIKRYLSVVQLLSRDKTTRRLACGTYH